MVDEEDNESMLADFVGDEDDEREEGEELEVVNLNAILIKIQAPDKLNLLPSHQRCLLLLI